MDAALCDPVSWMTPTTWHPFSPTYVGHELVITSLGSHPDSMRTRSTRLPASTDDATPVAAVGIGLPNSSHTFQLRYLIGTYPKLALVAWRIHLDELAS